MNFASFALCLLLLSFQGTLSLHANDDLLLREVAFIMTHDSSTAYLGTNIVADYAKTQHGNLSQQLDCGARSFDFRPYVVDGQLILHHGDVEIHHKAALAVSEVIQWAGAHPTELVIMYTSHCDGPDCTAMAAQMFKDLDVFVLSDCDVIGNTTLGHARNMSRLHNGGHVLALFGCVDERYDSSTECYMEHDGHMRVCYQDPYPLQHMAAYLTSTTQSPSSNQLWMAQGHWQYSTESVAEGLLHNSTILEDEARAQMNGILTANVTNGDFKHLNILEVDHVCDGGPELWQAIQGRYPHLGA